MTIFNDEVFIGSFILIATFLGQYLFSKSKSTTNALLLDKIDPWLNEGFFFPLITTYFTSQYMA